MKLRSFYFFIGIFIFSNLFAQNEQRVLSFDFNTNKVIEKSYERMQNYEGNGVEITLENGVIVELLFPAKSRMSCYQWLI
jgi:hypothetical protein